MEVGARVKRAREAAGMTQVELARALNVEQSTVSRWERDDPTPSLRWLSEIATATAQPLPFFFNEAREAR